MEILRSRVCASLAALAAATLTVSPAMAHGWGGYPPPPRHHHHRGGGGGDLLAGLLIGGGLVAIASAASNSNSKEREASAYPDDDAYVDQDASANVSRPAYPGGPVAGEVGYASPSEEERTSERHGAVGSAGFGAAVDTCTSEIEGGSRYDVQNVDKVDRMNGRIAVEGRLTDGRAFACSIDDQGRVRSVAVDGHAMI